MVPSAGSLKNLLWVTCVLIFSFSGKCQPDAAQVSFDHLTPENGLSHSTVYSILQDQTGLIWIGTRYGLNRFDGYGCKVFLPIEGDNTSLNGPTVLVLLEDKKGKIWIGHREAGISVWDKTKGQFKRFPEEPDPEVDWTKISVRSLYEDSRGWLWVGTLGRGVFVFDENRRKIGHLCRICKTKTQALGNDFVFDFQEDHLGRIWIATDGKGISVFDPATQISTVVHSNDELDLNSYEKSLCLDRRGNLWIGTSGSGLYKLDLSNQQFEHFFFDKNKTPHTISHNIVTDLALDPFGKLWIATDGNGLNVFDPEKNSFNTSKPLQTFPRR
ncbi:MAG: hypothetical protein IPL65_00465 [Lewinellaceae bacterium]|nr:hypothetical protein [Lewinellaceae bacterium]